MSDIDDKLKDVLNSFTDKPMPDNKHYRKGQDAMIEQIKQVFADAGYINMREAVSSQPTLQSAYYRGDGTRMLTGHEWYARFLFEYKHEVTYSASHIHTKEVLSAAKRASGIAND